MSDDWSNPLSTALGTLVRKALQSFGFVHGSTGWQIQRDGDAEFNAALIRGELDLGPASPAPRVAVNPNIPSELTNWDPGNISFNVVLIWYFNATDYYWQGIGTFLGANSYMEGTVDFTLGPYLHKHIAVNTPSVEYFGSNQVDVPPFTPPGSFMRLQLQNAMLNIGQGLGSDPNSGIVNNGTSIFNAIAFNANGGGTAEVWHAASFQNGWSDLGGGYVTTQYRKVASPPNCVQIIGQMLAPGSTPDGTIVFNLPAAYRPTHQQNVPLLNAGDCVFLIETTGNVKSERVPGGSAPAINCLLPLDA